MNFLLIYYFKSWRCPFKASRCFSCSLLILGGFLVIEQSWMMVLPLPFWPLSCERSNRITDGQTLPASHRCGYRARCKKHPSLYWPSRIAAIGNKGAGAFCSLETTQPLTGAENSRKQRKALLGAPQAAASRIIRLQRETAFISVKGWGIRLGRGKALTAHHPVGLAASVLGETGTSSFSKLSFQACIGWESRRNQLSTGAASCSWDLPWTPKSEVGGCGTPVQR